jgi:hypothetical protein
MPNYKGLSDLNPVKTGYNKEGKIKFLSVGAITLIALLIIAGMIYIR